jgi:hypothetical protein
MTFKELASFPSNGYLSVVIKTVEIETEGKSVGIPVSM